MQSIEITLCRNVTQPQVEVQNNDRQLEVTHIIMAYKVSAVYIHTHGAEEK